MRRRLKSLHLDSQNTKISREAEHFLPCISSVALLGEATHTAKYKCFSPTPTQVLLIADLAARVEGSWVQSPLSALSLTGNICALSDVLHLHKSRGEGGREHVNFTEQWVSWYKHDWFKHKHIPDIQVSDSCSPSTEEVPHICFGAHPFQLHLSPLPWPREPHKA